MANKTIKERMRDVLRDVAVAEGLVNPKKTWKAGNYARCGAVYTIKLVDKQGVDEQIEIPAELLLVHLMERLPEVKKE